MIEREYPPSPVIAVGGIVVQEGKVLLIRRGQEPFLGTWSIPGGAVEVGETLSEALRREILEETGLSVRTVAIVEVLDRIIRDEKGAVQYHYVLADYLCAVETGNLQPASDVTEARWASREDLPAYALRRETLQVIEKALSLSGAASNP